MKTDVVFLIAGFLAIVQYATCFETVWVRHVTEQYQANKRALGDLDLPDQLTFALNWGYFDLTLNLKRNYEIDPNADIYVVRKLKDGRSFLARTNELQSEAIAYYQDMDNGAYMTVRCVKRSDHNLDFVINGNIQIGDSNYDLRPVETDVASGLMSEVPSLNGKRYILLDQTNIGQENIVNNYDMENASETNLEEELIARLRRFTGQGKPNNFRPIDVTLPRYVTDLHDKRAQDRTRQPRQDYYVKVAVLIDFSVFNFYALREPPAGPLTINKKVQQKIKEAYSHIMNGVNLHYKTIDDPSISINIILQQFVFFQDEFLFPHNCSRVVIVNGTNYIHVKRYLSDLKQWLKNIGIKMVPTFDLAMLFTKLELYQCSMINKKVCGISFQSGICDENKKVSLIWSGSYVRTVQTAAHELGHTLGAYHDGELDAKECKAEDLFIMSPCYKNYNETTPYSRNPWLFSNCSVESFKKTLISKQCLKDIGSVYNEDEWNLFMRKQPGDVFTPDEQCYITFGPNTVHFGHKRRLARRESYSESLSRSYDRLGIVQPPTCDVIKLQDSSKPCDLADPGGPPISVRTEF